MALDAPTPEQLDAAMQGYRQELAQLHQLASRRDHFARHPISNMLVLADLNAQIAQQRTQLQSSRSALAAMLDSTDAASK